MKADSTQRPYYVYLLLNDLTDEDHPLTTREILELLSSRYGIEANRKNIPRDVELLQKLNVDVEMEKQTGRPTTYRLLSRAFEAAEVKLLIDAVHSSMFLTEKKSKALTRKLLRLVGGRAAEDVSQALVDNEMLKHDNENIIYIIDRLIDAILRRRQIAFSYFHYDILKRRAPDNGGRPYLVSPYALVWNRDNYYLIAWSEAHGGFHNFRVERMGEVPTVLEAEIRPLPEDFDLEKYKRTMFQMYNSALSTVELRCDASVMGAMVDRFGLEVETRPLDGRSFLLRAEVPVNHIFYSWVFGFGGKVTILGPEDVARGYAAMLEQAAAAL